MTDTLTKAEASSAASRPDPTAVWEDWTPEQAQKVLDTLNTGNRNLSTNVANSYAKKVREDEWLMTGDTIKFDWNGRLVDGQHRLEAIVKSGVPLRILTVRGVDPKVFGVLDQGLRRTAAQFMEAHGGTKASTVKRLLAFDGKSSVGGGHKIETTGNIFDLLDAWQVNDRDAIFEHFYPRLKALQTRTRIPIAPVAAVLIKSIENGRALDDEKIEEFLNALQDGIGFYKNDPRQFIREKFMREGVTLTKEWVKAQQLVVQAWNKSVVGEEMKQGRTTSTGFKQKIL